MVLLQLSDRMELLVESREFLFDFEFLSHRDMA